MPELMQERARLMEHRSGGADILVVDDTLENLRLLSSILTERGHEVRPVTSGPLALQAAQRSPPDVILLDVSMPEMNGFEVCARLKQMEALQDVPVIFLTSLTEASDKVKAFAAGGVDYVTKPFQIEEILARVDAQVALRRSRRELHASLDQLRALEKLRDDMVHMIVHDIRSPLGALMMLLEYVQESAGQGLSTNASESLQTAVAAAGCVNGMVNDLLDVSRLEEGKLPLSLGPTDVVAICGKAVELLRSLDKSRSIQVVASAPVALICDAGLLQRVIENLVSNAVKHTPSSGRVLVSVSCSGDAIRVEVRDEGPGVPAEAREKIFDRYATLSIRKDNKYHSVGLGLTFCRMAIEAHGGKIGVDAAEPNGSVFWFELPVLPRT